GALQLLITFKMYVHWAKLAFPLNEDPTWSVDQHLTHRIIVEQRGHRRKEAIDETSKNFALTAGNHLGCWITVHRSTPSWTRRGPGLTLQLIPRAVSDAARNNSPRPEPL